MDLSCEDAHIHVVNFEDFWLLEMPAFRATPRRDAGQSGALPGEVDAKPLDWASDSAVWSGVGAAVLALGFLARKEVNSIQRTQT